MSFMVYLPHPPLRPSTTISIHFFKQLPWPILSTCPNHLSLPLCMQILMLAKPRQTQLVRRLSILLCHLTHPPYRHVISLQLCQALFFHGSGLTTIENNILDTCLENVTSCAVSKDKSSRNFFLLFLSVAIVPASIIM